MKPCFCEHEADPTGEENRPHDRECPAATLNVEPYRDHVIAFSDDEIRIVSQALAYFESHMRGVAGSAAKIGWSDSAKGYERKVDATERLRDRIRKEAF